MNGKEIKKRYRKTINEEDEKTREKRRLSNKEASRKCREKKENTILRLEKEVAMCNSIRKQRDIELENLRNHVQQLEVKLMEKDEMIKQLKHLNSARLPEHPAQGDTDFPTCLPCFTPSNVIDDKYFQECLKNLTPVIIGPIIQVPRYYHL